MHEHDERMHQKIIKHAFGIFQEMTYFCLEMHHLRMTDIVLALRLL